MKNKKQGYIGEEPKLDELSIHDGRRFSYYNTPAVDTHLKKQLRDFRYARNAGLGMLGAGLVVGGIGAATGNSGMLGAAGGLGVAGGLTAGLSTLGKHSTESYIKSIESGKRKGKYFKAYGLTNDRYNTKNRWLDARQVRNDIIKTNKGTYEAWYKYNKAPSHAFRQYLSDAGFTDVLKTYDDRFKQPTRSTRPYVMIEDVRKGRNAGKVIVRDE